MGSTTTTVVTSLASRTAAELRLARRGAAASAEGHAGCLLLDVAAVIRQRELDRAAELELEAIEETRRLAATLGSYTAQRIVVAA